MARKSDANRGGVIAWRSGLSTRTPTGQGTMSDL